MTKWQVRIPHGRWMGGYVHRFSTKAKAIDFIDRWNTVEVNSGNASVMFHRNGRFGPHVYEPVEDRK